MRFFFLILVGIDLCWLLRKYGEKRFFFFGIGLVAENRRGNRVRMKFWNFFLFLFCW
jgi:hypothetical protein